MGIQINVQPPAYGSILSSPNSEAIPLSRFQRFIRRMESAGPKVVLDRLKEDWQETTSDGVDEEVYTSDSRVEDACANLVLVDSRKTALALNWPPDAKCGAGKEPP